MPPKPAEGGEIPAENRRLTRTRQKAKEVESKTEESSEPIEENRRLTRTTRKNQDSTVDDTGSKSDPKKSTMVESKVTPKPAEGEIPENRRLTRTRQKAQEIESKSEESSEPIEENRRLTRTTRKNQEDEADVAPPQRATRTLQSAKV